MTDPILRPEERKTFEEFYSRRIRDAGAIDHAGELEAARDLLEAVTRDGLTPTGDGGESYVRRGGINNWSDPTTAAAQAAVTPQKGGRQKGGGNGEMLQGLLILLGVVLAAGWWFWPAGNDTAVGADSPLPTPTAGSETGSPPTPVPTLEAALLADIVDSSGVRTDLVTPRTLEIAGVSFVVQPVEITLGDWEAPYDDRAVSWVFGTVVNYVMGLQATPDNKRLLTSLKTGDQLLLRMSTGAGYRFSVADLVRVSPQTTELFRQSRPGLTLALLEDAGAETRAVLRANFIPESELGPDANSGPLEVSAAPSETVILDGAVRVALLDARLLPRDDTPPGYVYQAVTYRLQNIGGLELATASFRHNIESSRMNYPIVAVPHERNPFPAEPALLAAGAVFSATALYAVPQSTLTSGLTWEFSPGPDGTRLRVPLPPYTGRLAPEIVAGPAVFSDTSRLQISLTITAALSSLEIGPADITIEGAVLAPTGNRFPWRVPAQAVAQFPLLLRYDEQRRQVIVTLLEQGFEFSWGSQREEAGG